MATIETAPSTEVPPPLESGDHLTRAEFERRYYLTPRNVKAELIDGVVYMASPVRAASHARPHGLVMTWLGNYTAATPDVELFDNATLRLDLDNEVQPDALLRIDEACGGHSRISSDDYLEGAPELIVEIAASSAAYDLHDKLQAYRRNGVEEYVVWTMHPRQVGWFRLLEGAYVPLLPGTDGIIRSEVFPGLRLAVAALLTGDLPTVLGVLQDGLKSDEHAAFVARLSDRR